MARHPLLHERADREHLQALGPDVVQRRADQLAADALSFHGWLDLGCVNTISRLAFW